MKEAGKEHRVKYDADGIHLELRTDFFLSQDRNNQSDVTGNCRKVLGSLRPWHLDIG